MDDPLSAGVTRRVVRAWSPQLENQREIDIFLPPSYPRSRRRYPVIYMQDGQNLADPHRAFAGTWRLEECLTNLARRGLEAIVVGIPNLGAERIHEYSPFADPRHGGGRGDAYLAFIERTLKPLVDRRVRTMPGPEATGIFGSSMGGLISLYSLFRAPETFGFAGAMSPSLWFGRRALLDYVRRSASARGRLYLDVGSEEGAETVKDASEFARLLEHKGFVKGETLLFAEVAGGRHEEAHWAERLGPALEFLLTGVPRSQPRRPR